MKQILLIAALLLTTGAAHAYPARYYDCGKAFVKEQMAHGTAPSGRRVFPMTWTIRENWEREDAENLPPIGSLNFKSNKDDKFRLNGKLCREMSDEEGRKEFGDDD
jgi:hypothetical protein